MLQRTSGEFFNVKTSANKIWRKLILETRGAEIAEAAFVIPVMFMVLLGIFWFGQAYSLYGTITRAAQEGARAGAAPYCTTCITPNGPVFNAATAVSSSLTISHLDPNMAQWPPTQPTLPNCAPGGPALTCNGASIRACVQLPAELVQPNGTGTGVCGISVTFQYPFRFYLPYTSVNNRQIMLNAAATARMETQ
jgi:hypothetical protein